MKTFDIKRTFIVAAAALASLASQAAVTGPVITSCETINSIAGEAEVTDVTLSHSADQMHVAFKLKFDDLKMKGDRAIAYVPMLVNGGDTLTFAPVTIYGRTRWIQYQRKGQSPFHFDGAQTSYKYGNRPSEFSYNEYIPFRDWMNGAQLVVRRVDYGCCNKPLGAADDVAVAKWDEVAYTPTIRYVRPVGVAEKRYELSGQSFVDFPVNQTVIYPDYRNNARELDSIQRTINVAIENPDAKIDTIWLKGFASPESPYSHNRNLAIGRTKALKEYLQTLYKFDNVKILTDFEPEDWEGLRQRVDASNLEHRQQILDLIDSNMEPDAKELKIKNTYPQEYKFMLQNFYPPLRHTNYRVSYTVRTYSDPAEIAKIMRTRPSTLSLNEFYILGATLTPGTPEFNEVFETAARMYPNDPAANLNAANAALESGNYTAAKYYLDKAGTSADADYARCILATVTGDYANARTWLDKALKNGYQVPSAELETLRNIINR